jgi:4'-phosphopantetheinyl transferase EntD
MLRAIFDGVGSVALASDSDETLDLFPSEMVAVANAVPLRRREFALGRACARRALAGFNRPPIAIPVGPDRRPLWPEGVVGSITHCEGFVGAVVASGDRVCGIGFDAERATHLGADLEALICTPEELAWVASAPPAPCADWPKVLFCAKEAVHKCVAASAGVMLDFLEVTVTLHPERLAFSAKAADHACTRAVELLTVSGRFALTPEFVFAGALIYCDPNRADVR